MPITKRQFELGIDDEAESLMHGIYNILSDSRQLAYSHDELRKKILGDSQETPRWVKFDLALRVLAEIGAADKGEVRDIDYYAFGQEVDTKSWEPKRRRSVGRGERSTGRSIEQSLR